MGGRVKNVCGCMDLRTGAYFIAIIQIIVGFVSIAAWDYGWIFTLFAGLCVAAGGGCLLLAAITHNRPAAIAYLVLTGIGIFLIAVTAIMIIIWALDNDHRPYYHRSGLAAIDIVFVILYVIWIGVLIYFLVCGYSFYKKL